MRLNLTAVAATGLIAAAALALPAEAAKKRYTTRAGYTYVQQRPAPATVIVTRGEDGRTRTKVLVQKRSYLDGGTEVMPGTYQPANASWNYGQRATDALGPNVITNPPGPIPDPFFLPGKNNPFPGMR